MGQSACQQYPGGVRNGFFRGLFSALACAVSLLGTFSLDWLDEEGEHPFEKHEVMEGLLSLGLRLAAHTPKHYTMVLLWGAIQMFQVVPNTVAIHY